MKRLLIARRVLLGLLTILIGCQGQTGIQSIPSTATQPTVLVIYDPPQKPPPLDESQVRKIVDCLNPLAPAGQRIWFMTARHVSYKQSVPAGFEERTDLDMTVYYSPNATVGRVRKGRHVHISFWKKDLDAILRANFGDQAARGKAQGQPQDYIQVSLSNEPFDQEPGRELPVPPPQLRPFPMPQGFADAEVIEIVDFARTSPERKSETDEKGAVHVYGGRFNGNEPLLSISRNSDGTVFVQSVTHEHPDGSGSSMKCAKKNGEWVVISVYSWCCG